MVILQAELLHGPCCKSHRPHARGLRDAASDATSPPGRAACAGAPRSRGIATIFAEWWFLLLTLPICALLLTTPLTMGIWPFQMVLEALLLAALFVVNEGLDATGVTTGVGQALVNTSGDSTRRLLVLAMRDSESVAPVASLGAGEQVSTCPE